MQKGVPQIMDITSIRSVLHDLSKNILPTKFETAQQPEPNTMQLCFRGVDSQTWLEVSWNGNSPRILKINKPEKIGRESTLSKQIRYGLKYMALISINQDDFERVIKFGFAKKPGDEISKYLIFELMGKHSNIFYLDNKHKIIAVGKQINSSQSSFRTISTGSIYSGPPANLKKQPKEDESFQSWKESISRVPESLKYCLINTYQGVSPILTKQLEVFSNTKDSEIMEKNIDFISDANLKEIFKSWKLWVYRFKNNNFNFSIFNNFFYCVWFLDKEINCEKKIDLCRRSINLEDMPLIIGVGDTVTSQKNVGENNYSRGGSDRSFLEFIQRLGNEFGINNKIIYVDSSSGEVERPSTKKTGLIGISDDNDKLKFDIVFKNGPDEYINWFIELAKKRSNFKKK